MFLQNLSSTVCKGLSLSPSVTLNDWLRPEPRISRHTVQTSLMERTSEVLLVLKEKETRCGNISKYMELNLVYFSWYPTPRTPFLA